MTAPKLDPTTLTPEADTDANRPSEWAMMIAAGLWARPQHEHKEMDGEFALSIAHALDATRAKATSDGDKKALLAYRIDAENLLKRCRDKMDAQDSQLRELRGKLDIFETMKRLFDAGRREDGFAMVESLSYLIHEMLEHGTPYPAAANTASRSRG